MERYRVNEPSVIHQTIEGETVIIHLENGLYYSLDEQGARIWEWLALGATPESIVERLAPHSATPAAEIAAAVHALVGRLRAEDLVVPVATGDGPVTLPPSEPDPGNGPVAFSEPRFERFDDLQDLLLLDPIHAVDETGWPSVGQGTTEPRP